MVVKMLKGEAVDKGHKPYNLEDPLTVPGDIEDWAYWYRHTKYTPDTSLVEQPVKIQSSFAEWQRAGKPKAQSPQGEREIRVVNGVEYAVARPDEDLTGDWEWVLPEGMES